MKVVSHEKVPQSLSNHSTLLHFQAKEGNLVLGNAVTTPS